MPPSGVDYASEFLNGYAPEYVRRNAIRFTKYHHPFYVVLPSDMGLITR